MPGPPQNPNRQRRNKPATAAAPARAGTVLRKGKAPALPNRGRGRAWHPKTRQWWGDVWSSPHAWRYSQVELDGLMDLAEIMDTIYKLPADDDRRLKWHAEARMQRRDYGLTPADRLRLGWSEDDKPVETVPAEQATPPAEDPRGLLRVVN